MEEYIFKKDLYRQYGKTKLKLKELILLSEQYKHIKLFRKCQKAKGLDRKIKLFKLRKKSKKNHIDISTDAIIGPGLMIAHIGWIIVGPGVVMGKNITLSPGVVIGSEWRGKREGCPTFGNNVYVGANSTIVGKITIGDDVLIAPGAFINFDVPSHSVVFGNPGVIRHKDFATQSYIEHSVD